MKTSTRRGVCFDFPERIVRKYLGGASGWLAQALHIHFGMEVYCLQRSGVILQYVARLRSSDNFIDIAGIYPRDEILRKVPTEPLASGKFHTSRTRDSSSIRRDRGGSKCEALELSPISASDPNHAEGRNSAGFEDATKQAALIMRKLRDCGRWPEPSPYSCEWAWAAALIKWPEIADHFLLSEEPLKKSRNVFRGWRYSDMEEVVVKVVVASKGCCESLGDIMETFALMSRLGVTVPIYAQGKLALRPSAAENRPPSEIGFLIMEKAEVTYYDVLKTQEALALALGEKIRKKLSLMHANDVAHGDLHPCNIVCCGLSDLQKAEVYIIDFDHSFRISRRMTPELREWMDYGFNWEGSFEEFVANDFDNWVKF